MSLPVLPPLSEARDFNNNYILFWNNVALDLNRLVHTNSGPQNGPPVSARALGILHLAIQDAYFGIFPYSRHPGAASRPAITPYLTSSLAPGARTVAVARKEAKDAVAGAAITVLSKLYKNPAKPNPNTSKSTILALGAFIDSAVRSYANTSILDFRSIGYMHGVNVARAILDELEIKATEPGADAVSYVPMANKSYAFDDDPSHPVQPRPIDPNYPDQVSRATRPYHAPFYGTTAVVLATTEDLKIADPYVHPRTTPTTTPNMTLPVDPEYEKYKRYLESLEDVHRMGGAEGLPSTKRRHVQTAEALFWAYDGVNLIGTPPRLYNQIIRQVAYEKKQGAIDSDINNAEFARLLALVNVAMADAGIFCWREKYRYELWRPLSGVRQHPDSPAPCGFARPFWKVLGAPATNSNEGGFKPPFPAYPSGHATFGAAAFQIVRRFYHERDGTVAEPVITALPPAAKKTGESGSGNPLSVQGTRSTTEEPRVTDQKTTAPPISGNDTLGFTFVSDELNGISRELYQRYDPSRPVTDQPGDVRTRLTLKFDSMKHAIFSNAISRIWLGVHWHFDAFAGEDIMPKYDKTTESEDKNPQRPVDYVQLYKCEADGSTKYDAVNGMDWFHTKGEREGDTSEWCFGGVPLGMLIADNVFESGMKFLGSLKNLSMEPARVRTLELDGGGGEVRV